VVNGPAKTAFPGKGRPGRSLRNDRAPDKIFFKFSWLSVQPRWHAIRKASSNLLGSKG
jgi:hypothetical protein